MGGAGCMLQARSVGWTSLLLWLSWPAIRHFLGIGGFSSGVRGCDSNMLCELLCVLGVGEARSRE